MWVHRKIHFLGRGSGGGVGVHKKKSNILRGIAYKKGLGQFADLRQGAWKKKRAMRSMKIISSHQAEFSYPAFFELV